jgi:hypothetical protein
LEPSGILQRPRDADRISTDRPYNRQEFHHVDPSFAAQDFPVFDSRELAKKKPDELLEICSGSAR